MPILYHRTGKARPFAPFRPAPKISRNYTTNRPRTGLKNEKSNCANPKSNGTTSHDPRTFLYGGAPYFFVTLDFSPRFKSSIIMLYCRHSFVSLRLSLASFLNPTSHPTSLQRHICACIGRLPIAVVRLDTGSQPESSSQGYIMMRSALLNASKPTMPARLSSSSSVSSTFPVPNCCG